jgi:hypothetical protein
MEKQFKNFKDIFNLKQRGENPVPLVNTETANEARKNNAALTRKIAVRGVRS